MMKGLKNIVYLSFALGMLLYSLPHLKMGQGASLPTIFAVVWLVFALTIIAAHLHAIIGVDEEAEKQLERVMRVRAWRMQQTLKKRSFLFHRVE